MATTIARIPTELADQWSNEEHEDVRALINERNSLLVVANDEEADLEAAADADQRTEEILADLEERFGVTAEMLAGMEPADELAESTGRTFAHNTPDDEPEPDEDGDDDDSDADMTGTGIDTTAEVEINEQTELPLDIPGAVKGKTSFKGVTAGRIALEGKLMGMSIKQLGGEVTDPDRIVELRVLARVDHNEEVPVRDGSGEGAQTQSVIKRQIFRPLRMEVIG